LLIKDTDYRTLVDVFCWRAHNHPTKRCFTYLEAGEVETAHLDFGELDHRARAFAVNLLQYAPAEDRALLLFPPGLEFIIAFVGCLYANIIAVPAPPPRPNQSAQLLATIMDDADIALVISTDQLLPKIRDKLEPCSPKNAIHFLAFDDLDLDLNLDLSAAWQPAEQTSESIAFLQYTSGSTGRPKGVMVSHGNILSNSKYLQTAFELSPSSVAVTWLPNFHDMGLIDGIIQPLFTGFHTYLMAPANFTMLPIRWLRAISKYRATHCGGPNFAYDLCVRRTTPEQRDGLDLSCWISAYNGAEPIHADTLQRFISTFESYGFKSEFMYPCYGLAEATLMVSGSPVSQSPVLLSVDAVDLERKRVTNAGKHTVKTKIVVGSGRAWLDTKIKIVNANTLLSCSTGQVGEVWVAGPSVTRGYWKRPEATDQTFNAFLADSKEGPFLRSGDLGFMQEGELFIVGRIKDMIIIRGQNYYPQDIERTVEGSHKALRNGCSAAFKVEAESEERLVVVQEVERSYLRTLKVSEVMRSLRQSLASQHGLRAHQVYLLRTGSIPKTSSGKIQRSLCREHFLSGKLISFDGAPV
jgi:acyl-CoA synthetase (AMP-forming)/AMP-acid ligase II